MHWSQSTFHVKFAGRFFGLTETEESKITKRYIPSLTVLGNQLSPGLYKNSNGYVMVKIHLFLYQFSFLRALVPTSKFCCIFLCIICRFPSCTWNPLLSIKSSATFVLCHLKWLLQLFQKNSKPKSHESKNIDWQQLVFWRLTRKHSSSILRFQWTIQFTEEVGNTNHVKKRYFQKCWVQNQLLVTMLMKLGGRKWKH